MPTPPESSSSVDGAAIVHQHNEVWLKIQIASGYRTMADGWSYGAAAAVVERDDGSIVNARHQKINVHLGPELDSDIADLTAICLGLQIALNKWHSDPRNNATPWGGTKHGTSSYLHTTIQTHSSFAISSMTTLRQIWHDNGWIDVNGSPIPQALRRTMEVTSALTDQVHALGELHFLEVAGEQNQGAIQALDEFFDEVTVDHLFEMEP